MWTKAFWKGAAERMIRAFAAAFLAVMIGPNVLNPAGVDVRHVGWEDAASFGLGAAVVSLLLSIIANATDVGPTGSASMVYDRPRDIGIQPKDGS